MEKEELLTSYRYGKFEVKNLTYPEFSNLLDIVIELYLDLIGTDDEDVIEAFTSNGYTVSQVED